MEPRLSCKALARIGEELADAMRAVAARLNSLAQAAEVSTVAQNVLVAVARNLEAAVPFDPKRLIHPYRGAFVLAQALTLAQRRAPSGRGLNLRQTNPLAAKAARLLDKLGSTRALQAVLALLLALLLMSWPEPESEKLETAPVKPERIPPPIPPPLDPSRQTLFLNAPNVA